MTWWTNLSQGQGAVLSGLITALGAVVGILIAGRFFSGKVKTLKEALEASQKLLEDHSQKVATTLTGIGERISILDAQASSLSSGVARIESNVGELADNAEEAASTQPGTSADADAWTRLREAWIAIRDELVRRASDDAIDGRTRAAYGRVDKRMIYNLVDRMRERGDLSDDDAKDFERARQIWQRYKNRRKEIDGGDLGQLDKLKSKLINS